MVKLHLGCGDKKFPGFVNIDIRKTRATDKVMPADKLKIQSNSVSLIYASHILEHFGRHETIKVLKEWYRVLKPKGILRIAVPDFTSVAKWYLEHRNIEELMGLLYGGQNYKHNFHKVGFDFKYLVKCCLSAGFKDVWRYDWRKTTHANIDDYSQSYLPHMDKEGGQLMSLNVEAVK
jgi:predicted SAM-dependent methyltransferase